uniref:Uncharacterized protein n=1 Tax=Comamonas testosteroni TaxID=285 RepID=A0A6H1Q0Z4_COMTE|nr:hypothetical protein [Comamonas testosteroni]
MKLNFRHRSQLLKNFFNFFKNGSWLTVLSEKAQMVTRGFLTQASPCQQGLIRKRQQIMR